MSYNPARMQPHPPAPPPLPGKHEPANPGNEGFPKVCRLRQRWEFEQVYRQGKKSVQRHLILYTLSTGAPEKKAGIAVGKTLGSAVTRNRLRRRIREALRRTLSLWQPGHRVVVVARTAAKDLDYRQLKETIEGLLIRSGVMTTAD